MQYVQSKLDYYYNCFTTLWILSVTTRMSQYQEGKTNLDLLEQESGIGISWAICKYAPHPRQITTPAPINIYRMDAHQRCLSRRQQMFIC